MRHPVGDDDADIRAEIGTRICPLRRRRVRAAGLQLRLTSGVLFESFDGVKRIATVGEARLWLTYASHTCRRVRRLTSLAGGNIDLASQFRSPLIGVEGGRPLQTDIILRALALARRACSAAGRRATATFCSAATTCARLRSLVRNSAIDRKLRSASYSRTASSG